MTWTVSGAGCSGPSCGTISSSGLYTSPAAVPTPAVVSVTATSVADPGKYASATVSLVAPQPPPVVAVAVTPASASVTIGATQQFAASVTGPSNTAVTWTVSGAGCSGTSCGTISSSGLYTSPATVPAPAVVTVTATSVAQPGKYASAAISLVAPLPPAAVGVAITPGSASVTIGTTQQFAASVTGESNTAVTWTVSGAGCSGPSCGTISSSGLYTSPAAVPAPAIVTVTATSVAEPAKYASATISLVAPQPPPVVAVAVTPASASITIGATQQFAASVTGASNTAVTWTVSGTGCSGPSCGTISSSGLYTSPAAVPAPAIVTVTATSVAEPANYASATVSLVAPQPPPVVAVAVTPASASVTTGATQQFTASVTGASNTAVTWTVSGAGCSGSSCGTISSGGLYTGPAAVPNPATVIITATSVADQTKYASATVSLAPLPPPAVVAVTVTPGSASVTIGATQQFAASVTGTSNTAVTWTVSGAGCSSTSCGTISSSGVYTGPAAVPASDSVTVTATSVADTSKSASATLSLVPPQIAGYNLVWQDPFSTLSLCTTNVTVCNWYNPGVYQWAAGGVISDPTDSYVNLQWASDITGGNFANISTAATSGDNYHAWTFGYFEVKMAFDPATGSWPGIWLMPIQTRGDATNNGAELDNFEWQSNAPSTFYGTLHVWSNGVDQVDDSQNAFSVPAGTDFSAYHTYGVLWTKTSITWYFDNQQVGAIDTTQSPYNTVFAGQQSLYLILGQQSGCNWSYSHCAGQASPLNMQVESVHVYAAQ